MPPPQAYGLQGPTYREPPGEYSRTNLTHYGNFYSQGYSASYPSNGAYSDPYAYPYSTSAYPPPSLRRDEATTARRLSDRISGYAPGFDPPTESPVIPANAGLPPKPVATLEPAPPRRVGRGGNGAVPPPPPDAKEDPRAAAGKKVSYHDMDLVSEGDVELTY